MAALNPRQALLSAIGEGLDDDISSYLCSVLEEMSLQELRSAETLTEVVAPFLVSTGSHTETQAAHVCRLLATSFGGSGYSRGNESRKVPDVIEDAPLLLSAPIKLSETAEVKQLNKKHTYGGAQVTSADGTIQTNSDLGQDGTQLPATKSAMKRQRRENEILARKLQEEAQRRAAEAAESMAARMAAIRATRASGGAHKAGVQCDSLTLPHPSGKGDLLTDAQLNLAPGRRYGLTGRNGVGKSTLLRALANYKVPGLTHLRILLVDQHVEGDDESALQWLLRADVERTMLLQEEERLKQFMSADDTDEAEAIAEIIPISNKHTSGHKAGSISTANNKQRSSLLPADLRGVDLTKALQEVWDRMETINVRSAEQRARVILRGLGFEDKMMIRPTSTLSGGWAMRAALASAIFVSPNLLLLDEPTNHLDLHALVWLEDWLLNKFGGILVCVSHDQYFLNSICTDVLELRTPLGGANKSTLLHFSGDYQTYERTLHEKRVNLSRSKESYEKEKEKLQEFIAREGKKYDNPQHQAQRKMKMKQLSALEEVEVQEDEEALVLSLPAPNGTFDSSEKLIKIQNVAFAWPQVGQEEAWQQQQVQPTAEANANILYQDPLFKNVDFVIQPNARIAIVGRNGCGKTSLLNLLMGEASATEGSVVSHPGCRICMLQQHHYKGEQLDPDKSPLDHIKSLPQDATTAVGVQDPGSRHEEAAYRTYLSRFGIRRNPAVLPVKYLSGGQRMRVAMAVALFRRPDLLVLDEPTNHLDSDTVRALCDALETYEGAIIAVSHDEAFVNRVISSGSKAKSKGKNKDDEEAAEELGGDIMVMAKNRVTRFEGTFRDYKRMIRTQVMAGKDHHDL